MSDDQKAVLIGLAGGLLIATFICIGLSQSRELRQTAIELGYARYNATNGDWEWITNR